MLTKNCEWCQAEFTGEKRSIVLRRFCSSKCAAFWRERDRPCSNQARLEKRCAQCGARIPPERDARVRFCGQSCATKLWMSDPERVRRLQTDRKRQRCREVIRRPDVQAKRLALIERQRAMGFPGLTYHNGSGPTVAQKMLFDALPVGAVMEFPVSMGSVGTPARVDIAIPLFRLAIEVDGHSHSIQSRKDIDAKKERVLRERGWTLLRFSNAEIVRHLPWVLARIRATVTMLQKPERVSYGSVA